MKLHFKKLARIFRFIFPKSRVIFNDLARTEPVSRLFGFDRGTPIDRYYVEKFLQTHSQLIQGRVLEVADNYYTVKFGQPELISEILHYNDTNSKATLVGDLTKPEFLPQDCFDCFICTQTLNFIYQTREAMRGCHALLKPGGVLLGTVSGLAQISRYDMERWGDYWRFTDRSIKMLLEETGFIGAEVIPMGNMLAATALLQGLAIEDLPHTSLLDKPDEDYQVTICFLARK